MSNNSIDFKGEIEESLIRQDGSETGSVISSEHEVLEGGAGVPIENVSDSGDDLSVKSSSDDGEDGTKNPLDEIFAGKDADASGEDENKDTQQNDVSSDIDEAKESWLQATNRLALQFGNFLLNNREYAALGFIIFATLPLFNFASMGVLAFVAMPVLALAAMQVLYFEKTSSVLRDGVKLNTSYVNGLLDLEQIKYNPAEVVEEINSAEDEVVSFLQDGDEPADSENLLPGDTKEENTYWEAFKSFNLVKLFSNLHPSVIADKWEEAGTKESWADLGVNFAKIAVLYTGIYFAASAVTPFLVSPMHSLLALGGSYALVGSYFVALGLGYGLSYATDTKISEENTYWLQGSGIAALTAVAALATVAILFAPATWWTTLLAAPGALAAVAPSIIAVAALGAYTSNAINAKGPEFTVEDDSTKNERSGSFEVVVTDVQENDNEEVSSKTKGSDNNVEGNTSDKLEKIERVGDDVLGLSEQAQSVLVN